jgi:hypothetical protein
MALQLHATDNSQSADSEEPLKDGSAPQENLAPAASLTGDVVMRGRKRPGFRPAEVPPRDAAPITAKEPQTEVETEEPVPAANQEADTEPVLPPDEPVLVADPRDRPDVQSVLAAGPAEEESAKSVQWFNRLRNAALFLVLFWVGAIIAVMAL